MWNICFLSSLKKQRVHDDIISHIDMRPSYNIYGHYDKLDLEHSHVFGAAVNKILNCKDGEITLWGDGSEQRDLLYITDLVRFVRLAIGKKMSLFA